MNAFKSMLLGMALSAVSLGVCAAIVEGRTATDRPYMAGGVGLEESERLKQMGEKYPLQVVVSSKSGAYLADTKVTIVGANGQKILDLDLDAPMLLVDLPPGSYKISVAHGGSTQERNVTLTPGKREHMAIQFNVPADTAKNPAPAK